MKKNNIIWLFVVVLVFLFSLNPVLSSNLLALEANIFDTSGNPADGNITVEIWDSSSGGNLIYNSSDAFIDNITSGKVDIMLGSPTSGIDLNLSYGLTYYMDLYVNNDDINFSGFDRQEFQSSVGNITLDNINFSTSIIPDANITYDLGSPITYFRNLYVNAINILTNLAVGGNSPSYILDVDGNVSIDGSTFVVDDINNWVGIGTTSPTYTLNVDGTLNITGNALFENDINITGNIVTYDNRNLTLLPNNIGMVIIGDAGTPSNLTGSNDDLYVSGNLEVDGISYLGDFKIQDELNIGNNNISSTYVGIGTLSPSSTLDVYGGNLTISNSSADDLVYFKFSSGSYMYDNGTALILGA